MHVELLDAGERQVLGELGAEPGEPKHQHARLGEALLCRMAQHVQLARVQRLVELWLGCTLRLAGPQDAKSRWETASRALGDQAGEDSPEQAWHCCGSR